MPEHKKIAAESNPSPSTTPNTLRQRKRQEGKQEKEGESSAEESATDTRSSESEEEQIFVSKDKNKERKKKKRQKTKERKARKRKEKAESKKEKEEIVINAEVGEKIPLLVEKENVAEKQERLSRMQEFHQSGLLTKLEQLLQQEYPKFLQEQNTNQLTNSEFVEQLTRHVIAKWHEEPDVTEENTAEIHQAIADMNLMIHELLKASHSVSYQTSRSMKAISIIYTLIMNGILSYVLSYLAKSTATSIVSITTCLAAHAKINCISEEAAIDYPGDIYWRTVLTVILGTLGILSVAPFAGYGNYTLTLRLEAWWNGANRALNSIKNSIIALFLGAPPTLASIFPTHDAVKTFAPQAGAWLRQILAGMNVAGGSAPNAMVFKTRGKALAYDIVSFWSPLKQKDLLAAAEDQSTQMLTKIDLLNSIQRKLFKLKAIHTFVIPKKEAQKIRQKVLNTEYVGLAVLAGLTEPSKNYPYPSKTCLFYFTLGMGLTITAGFFANYNNFFLIRDKITEQLQAWGAHQMLAEVIGHIAGFWGSAVGAMMHAILTQTGGAKKIFRGIQQNKLHIDIRDIGKLTAPLFVAICNFAIALVKRQEVGGLFWPALIFSSLMSMVMGYEGATDTITEIFPNSHWGRNAVDRNEVILTSIQTACSKLTEIELRYLDVALNAFTLICTPVATTPAYIEERAEVKKEEEQVYPQTFGEVANL